MTTYHPGRKAPNVSQYVANLNAIPSAQDVANQEENLSIDDQLTQFTNAEFFDFDAGPFLEQTDYNHAQQDEEMGKADASKGGEVKTMDFVNGAFSFADAFSPLTNQTTMPTALQTSYTTSTSPTVYHSPNSPISFASTPYPTHKPHTSLPNNPTTTTPNNANNAAYHHKPTNSTLSASPTEPTDTLSRLAAEEDKRRRNTAASARFRVKKKQREQALENTAKELENKTVALEQRIVQLEMENEWLRGLVVEKNGGEKEDLRAKYQRNGAVGAGERKTGKAKKGVGTVVETSSEEGESEE